MKNKSIIAAAVGLVSAVSFASADTTLHLDVNDVTATASGVTGLAGGSFTSQILSGSGYTGTITLTIQGSSRLSDVAILGLGTLPGFFEFDSGSAPSATNVDALKAVTGTITVAGNVVTGVGFAIEAWDSQAAAFAGSGASTTYSASIFSGSGTLDVGAGGIVDVDGLTFAGLFSSSTYAGTDVSAFVAAQPLFGNFLNFQMQSALGSSNTTGIFTNSQLDVYITIPLPATSGLAIAGFCGLGVVRRRR